MAKLGINTGSNPNDGQGDPLRVAMGKINSNFTEIYNVIGDGNNLISYASTAGISTLARNLTGSPRINVSGILNTGITTTEHLEVRNITSSGIITAVQFIGDGSQLENVVATSAGVEVLDDSVRRGVAQELNFGENIVCSGPDGAGRVTISVGNNVIVGYAVTYAEVSGVSTYAGVATYAVNSGISTYAGVAGVATYAGVSGVSSLATFAANAGGATYAALAGVATYAGVAGVATYAGVAGVATYAALAGVATYAGVAGVATYAGVAGVATYSGIAGVATYAGVAGVATYAGVAGVATYSGIAGVATYSGIAGVATYAGVAGVSTALQNSRTFQITGDVVASSVSFDGTGNVSLAATIQPNSVGLGTDTTGDYVRDLTGTANQITVTSGTGEGSSPIVSIANNPTIPGNVTIGNDLQVNNNLNVTGNITIGGTSAYVISDEFRVKDADIVLGFTTNISGQDSSTDNTANHGGIAVASTEGTPLVSLFIAGIETNPPTYKKIMWFKSGSFAGLNTDAWLSNYAVGIGSTQFPVGTRLAAGSVQFNDRDLTVVRGINASGIVTGSSFRPSSGYIQAADGTNSFFIYNSTGNVAFQGTIGASQINNASGFKVIGFAGTDITFENNARISGVTTSVGGFVGNLTGTATTATNSGYASLAGVATYAGVSGVATYAGTSGVSTYSNLAGVATYAGVSGVATYAGTSGVSTTSGYATTAGISTLSQGLTGTPNISVNQVGISSNLSVSGITTFYNDVHIESNRSLLIGSNDELQLFNSGLDSYIENTSAGNLIIRDGGTGIQLRKSGGGPGAGLMAVFNTDAGVELYYNSVIKLQTFQNGVAINESVGIGSTASNPPYRLTVSGVGATITQGLTNAIADLTSSVNGYGQVNIRNSLSGTNASGDLVITADTGTDTSNYVNLGINNTGFTTSSWTISGPLDGYLYTSDGNLAIGAGASEKYISLFAGGTLAVNEVVRVSDLGVGIYKTNPEYALDIVGDINFSGTFRQNGNQFVASRWTPGTGDDIYRLTGNVGIWTTNPRVPLEVGAVGASGTSLLVNGDARITGILTIGTSSITLNGDTNTLTVPNLVVTNNTTGVIASGVAITVRDGGGDLGNASIIDFGDNLSVSFSAGIATITGSASGTSSQWVTTTAGIHTLSNVGVGTTNPTSALTVKGNTSLETLNVSGVSTFNGRINAGTGGILFDTGSYSGSDEPIKLWIGNSGGARYFTLTRSNGGQVIFNNAHPTGTNDHRAPTHSFTQTGGDYYALFNNGSVKLYHPASSSGILDQKFETLGTGVTITGTTFTNQLSVSGIATFTNNINLNTGNLKVATDGIIKIGGSDQLELYYNGSTGQTIKSTGDLRILTNRLLLNNSANDEQLIEANQNGSVALYYDNSKKFETLGTGVTITGTTFTNQLNVSGVSTLSSNVSVGGTINLDGGVRLATNNPTIVGTSGTVGEIKRIGGAPFFYDGSAWREFVLSSGTPVTVPADTEWDNVVFRSTFDTDFTDAKFGTTPVFVSAGSTIVGSPTKIGTGAFRNDGTAGAGVSYAYRSDYDFTGSWTIEFWMYHDSIPPSNVPVSLVSQISTSDGSGDWTLGMFTNGVNLWWYWDNENNPSNAVTVDLISATGFNNVYVDKWVHYVLVREGDNGSLHFYRDGVESVYTASDAVIDNDILHINGAGLAFGAPYGNVSINTINWNNGASIDGIFDDVRISCGVGTAGQRYTSVGITTTTTFTPPTTALPTTGTLSSYVQPPGDKYGEITLGGSPTWRGTSGVTVSQQSSGNYRVSFASSYTNVNDYFVLTQPMDQGFASYVGVARSTTHVDFAINRESDNSAVNTGSLSVQIKNHI